MRKGAVLAFALSAACLVSLSATAQPPGEKGKKGGEGGRGSFQKGGPGGPGGGFGMRGGQPGQVLPAFLQERLKLNDDQKKQVADLQKDVETKLDKILTDEQRAELKKMREQGPGGFGGAGSGGGGFGKGGFGKGKGGPGGPGGPGKEKQKD